MRFKRLTYRKDINKNISKQCFNEKNMSKKNERQKTA